MFTKFLELCLSFYNIIEHLFLDITDILHPFNNDNNNINWYKDIQYDLDYLSYSSNELNELEDDEDELEEELDDDEDDEDELEEDELEESELEESELDDELEEEEELYPTKIRLVSIEGNIGAGKTTLISKLKAKYEERDDILFLEEPIDVWNTIQDENGKNILQNFYKNLGKYAFAFQVMAYTTRLQLMKKTIENAPRTVKVIVMERSLEADANIFAKMLFEEGIMNRLEYQIYLLIARDNWEDYGVDGIIWLRTEANECYSRIQSRNREGEEGIDLAYLRKCEEYHLEWLSANLGFVCDIGKNLETDLEKIEKYLDL